MSLILQAHRMRGCTRYQQLVKSLAINSVFNWRRTVESKGTLLISYGMVFQIVGAAKRKPRWLITVFVVGKLNLSESVADHSA